ncbi:MULTISPECIES: hypothetical protein [Nitrosopumilus]|uniref:Uncharacterized protein n=1 Tax=Nitrosopumilus piranensis TaxID=1582439 RepID=A0A0C5CCR2_9ARCH|nr:MULTISPECIES: hypothetical protein [Nitrosopumilus]AJM92962.1 hypothetical protein NPIRD3C_1750 [Nitrosopumilus piranensis]KAF6244826.1 hypothetical protein C6989_06400 [Nitrosopumilus sp. b2]
MSELKLSYSGYVCAPYLHTHESIELKESWMTSKNIERLYFVTCTFSSESKPYFSDSTNHYLLAKFKDSEKITNDLIAHNQEKTSFVFNVKDDLFEHEVNGDVNFVSVYYMEYGEDEDVSEIAQLLVKKDQIEKAGIGNVETFCSNPSKFTFPYSENIIVIEVASEKSHQSVKKYCEQTRRDANRRGLTMTNLMSLSLLEQLK